MILFFTCSAKPLLSKEWSGMLLRQFGGNLWQTKHEKTPFFWPKWVEMVQIGFFVIVFITFEPQMVSTISFHQKIQHANRGVFVTS